MPATESNYRDVKAVHVVFAVSSIVLLLTTLWMMGADQAREWTGYQRKFEDLQTRKQLAAINAIKTSPQYETSESELKAKKEAAQKQLDSIQPEVDKANGELAEADRLYDQISRTVRNVRAYRDKARADFDLGVRDGVGKARLDDLQNDYTAKQAIVDKDEFEMQEKKAARDAAQAKVKTISKSLDDSNAALTKLNTDLELREKALAKLDPTGFSAFKKEIMEWPIINGFNSPLKITQDWLPTLTIQLGMARTARFDRCRTCHQGIERVEAGNLPSFPFGHPSGEGLANMVLENKYPNPYSTHPNPDLYLTAVSPHPLQKFGCTICHDGQGSGTSFKDASHTPNNPYEYEQWHAKHHYASNHFWEFPMQPERLRESTCIKCHHSVVELGVHPTFGASAPKLYKGYNLIKEYGCFGCHEIQGFDGTRPIGPDLRLEPSTEAEAARIAADPTLIAGTMRKVGPSLRHVGKKLSPEFISYWVEEPKRFRPTTRMPQFFHTSNLDDSEANKLQPVEIVSIAHYLTANTENYHQTKPAEGYAPDPVRGKDLFSKRGCLACHSHEAFPDSRATFGPELSRVHSKIRPGEEGFAWVYSWIRDPQAYHKRSRMPNLFLEPYAEGGQQIDPAADIAAFLLQKGPEKFAAPTGKGEFDQTLDELVKLNLSKQLSTADTDKVLSTRQYPTARSKAKGDEIELATTDGKPADAEQWQQLRLNYVGRRTISRYGCYGCHDIPNFETARPIGTTLQDWGRKDTSRLAPEHIEEYLEKHGEADGSSTHEKAVEALKAARGGGTATGEFKGDEQEVAMRKAYFYNDLIHHGRAGFLWQKLRDPRSYDYLKTETKGYDERLRMPKFPFNEEEIEAISTFVLGLVADPPAKEYIFNPPPQEKARIEGERLLDRYNCVGCHMVDMPEIRYGVEPSEITATALQPGDYPEARDLLLKLKPPHKALMGDTLKFTVQGAEKSLPVMRFYGLIMNRPDPTDPPDDQEYAYDLWETLDVDGKTVFPASRLLVKKPRLAPGSTPQDGYAVAPRGGDFAQWLVEKLSTTRDLNRQLAWQMAPPPLYKEGLKVQTPWLYQFLREPYRLRQTTVLRMPRFNMSAEEAQTLANYFAAVDSEPFPYQKIPQRDPDYLAAQAAHYEKYLAPEKADYLTEGWHVFNGAACINCHSLAGREVKVGDPKKDIRGPNLEYVSDRLRPDWLMLWLYSPRWITPYTSMPQVFPKNQSAAGDLAKYFGAENGAQVIATRDALVNYHRLMEAGALKKSVAEAPTPNPAPSSRSGRTGTRTRSRRPPSTESSSTGGSQ
jgi:mono/diheme cytochrome c family protein